MCCLLPNRVYVIVALTFFLLLLIVGGCRWPANGWQPDFCLVYCIKLNLLHLFMSTVKFVGRLSSFYAWIKKLYTIFTLSCDIRESEIIWESCETKSKPQSYCYSQYKILRLLSKDTTKNEQYVNHNRQFHTFRPFFRLNLG